MYNALIRTHHITSRKKVAALKRAADAHRCSVLLRSGGCPGIMYVEAGKKDAVESWVSVVRNLRYKDFQLVARPDVKEEAPAHSQGEGNVGLSEVDTVKEFGSAMQQRGVWEWWRRGMGYTS